MDQDMVRAAQLANVRAVGLEAMRMQVALECYKIGLADSMKLFGPSNTAEPDILAKLATNAVKAADAMMHALVKAC